MKEARRRAPVELRSLAIGYRRQSPAAYEKMSRVELIAELDARDQVGATADVMILLHDLEVHQEEIRIQNMQLIESQRDLEEAASRYADLYDFAPVPYVTLDEAGVIIEINLTGADFFGYERAHLIGVPMIHYLEPDDRSRFYDHLRRVGSGSNVSTELRALNRVKASLPVELNSRPLKGRDGKTQYRTAILDLRERKRSEGELQSAQLELEARVAQRTAELESANAELELEIAERKQLERRLVEVAERLREQDRRKDDFLAMLGHELRNPLAPIRAAIHLLEHVALDHEEEERAKKVIERQVDHLTKLVDDLLDVSRISLGKFQIHKERTALSDVLGRAIEAAQPAITSAGQRFETDIDREPLAIDADPVRMTQTIANLLLNASKYTPKGGDIHLRVRKAGGRLMISVKDSGVGVPPDQLPHLFELFFQADRSLDRSKGGLGLGLSLAKYFIELHGGTIEAKSDGKDQGSEFVVYLPLLEGAPGETEPGAEDVSAVPRRRLLIVDDNVDAADSLAALLTAEGHDVHIAYDADHALAMARELSPEIVLLDIGLPGIDGYEIAKRIRAQPGGDDIMLVAVTGYGEPEALRRSREAGFHQHLLKPLALKTIHRVLASCGQA